MSDVERRVISVDVEVRDAAEAAPLQLVGYGAVFGEETVIDGLFREVIAPSAFAEALNRDDVRALFNHDPNYVLGRTKAGTLTLETDARGLKYTVTPPPTTWANDLMASVKRGDVSQSSFAFRVTKDVWSKRGGLPLREIQSVELFDVSPVTYPAYQSTTVAARAAAATCAAHEAAEATAAGDGQAHARRSNRLVRAERELGVTGDQP